MKRLIYLLLILTACEPERIEPLRPIKPQPFISHRDTSTFKTGRYNGLTHLIIPGQVDIMQAAYREIYQSGAVYVVRWWTMPDTTALAAISDTLRYTMTYDNTNNSCGVQRFVYDYQVKSYRSYDSIFESGSVRYRWYYNGALIKDLPGRFSSRLRYVDRLTPNR